MCNISIFEISDFSHTAQEWVKENEKEQESEEENVDIGIHWCDEITSQCLIPRG